MFPAAANVLGIIVARPAPAHVNPTNAQPALPNNKTKTSPAAAKRASIMHKSDNTRIYVHTQAYTCKMDRMIPEAEAGQLALNEERHHYILELLGSEGRVLAADLSGRYRVSDDTIRRDLRELASSGKIQRVHGGALPRRAEAIPSVSPQQIDMQTNIHIARAAPA